MKPLTVFRCDGKFVVDSREVGVMVDKRHDNLIRDIEGYVQIIASSNLRALDFFIPYNYTDSQGKRRPCYLITRRGCDMVANKMTGEKGVLFTAEYVTRFEEMEKKLQPQTIEDLIIMQAESVKQLKKQVGVVTDELTTVKHRVDNLDLTNIEGTPRQRLNAMIRKYANQQGVTYKTAWQEFTKSYNTAYRMNLKRRKANEEAVLLKRLTMPEFLEASGYIEDAIRVADKMLNQVS
ncbi:MAG: Rha family transcriptional regulator [Candidatus Bathyarchaeia archaeon]